MSDRSDYGVRRGLIRIGVGDWGGGINNGPPAGFESTGAASSSGTDKLLLRSRTNTATESRLLVIKSPA